MNTKVLPTLVLISIAIFSIIRLNAQSVEELISNYSGTATWNAASKTMSFETSGTVYFANKEGNGNNPQTDQMQNFWAVPKNVRKIQIKENVKVRAAFHTYANCTIEGKDRKTSIVTGTDLQSWADKNNPSGTDLEEWHYSQFDNKSGILILKNLTSLNPFSYHVRGWGNIIHLDNCDFIDNRGGSHNHSDGFCGGDGSTVNNCYFETGDDVFKAYFDYTVSNCEIKMIDNAVPIQLGWGNYSNGAICNFHNLTITGTNGRWSPENSYGIIAGRKGKYNVTINIDGVNIDNPNAHLIILWEDEMTLNGEITNALINVKAYTQPLFNKGKVNITVCDSKEQSATYNCN